MMRDLWKRFFGGIKERLSNTVEMDGCKAQAFKIIGYEKTATGLERRYIATGLERRYILESKDESGLMIRLSAGDSRLLERLDVIPGYSCKHDEAGIGGGTFCRIAMSDQGYVTVVASSKDRIRMTKDGAPVGEVDMDLRQIQALMYVSGRSSRGDIKLARVKGNACIDTEYAVFSSRELAANYTESSFDKRRGAYCEDAELLETVATGDKMLLSFTVNDENELTYVMPEASRIAE